MSRQKKLNKILTKEFLVKELKNKYIRQIALEIECAPHSIIKRIKRFNINIDTKKESFKALHLGKKYNKLTIVDIARNDEHNKRQVKCKCDCGQFWVGNIASLKRGLTKSCGCHKTSVVRKLGHEDISYSYYRRTKQHAINKGLKFDITIQDIWDVYIKQDKKCKLSGVKIKFEPDYNKSRLQTASIDRISSDEGYTKKNIQIVHRRINIIKGNQDLEELKYWVYHLNKTLKPKKIANINNKNILYNKRLYEADIG